MGGHGGLNILPQKRWNVYNFDNREKVKKDEEEHAEKERKAREEQIQRDGEVRRNLLLDRAKRQKIARNEGSSSEPVARDADLSSAIVPAETSRHINLFEGLENSTSQRVVPKEEREVSLKEAAKMRERGEGDEAKYALGFGATAPWYVQKRAEDTASRGASEAFGFAVSIRQSSEKSSKHKRKSSKEQAVKSMDEMRRERVEREKRERLRAAALVAKKVASEVAPVAAAGNQRRYNSGFGYGR